MTAKNLVLKMITIGENEYELYEDTDKEGEKFYYLKLKYADDKWGGFLADEMGNLIDEDDTILTSVEDMEDLLEDDVLDVEEDDVPRGVMIAKIVESEEVESPDEEVGSPEEEEEEEISESEAEEPVEELETGTTDSLCFNSCAIPKVVSLPSFGSCGGC